MTQTVNNTDNEDPFAAAGEPDDRGPVDPNADPFATPSESGGGGGPKRPTMAELFKRLVVIKPIKLEENILLPKELQDETNDKRQDRQAGT